MPEFDGIGSQGSSLMIGRELGGCRMASVPAQEPEDAAQLAHNEKGSAISQGSAQNIPVYGRGHGGIPCGCGHGFGFSGGRRLQR